MGGDIAEEARALAEDLDAVCQGHGTAAVYLALSMMLGRAAAEAERPDFRGMMAIVMGCAGEEFRRAMIDHPLTHDLGSAPGA